MFSLSFLFNIAKLFLNKSVFVQSIFTWIKYVFPVIRTVLIFYYFYFVKIITLSWFCFS